LGRFDRATLWFLKDTLANVLEKKKSKEKRQIKRGNVLGTKVTEAFTPFFVQVEAVVLEKKKYTTFLTDAFTPFLTFRE